MSHFLPLLLLMHLAILSKASPTPRRLHFGINREELEISANRLAKPLTLRRNEHHRSSRFVFPSSGPAPANPRSASRIFFPGEETPTAAPVDQPAPSAELETRGPSSGVTTLGDVWFPGVNRDTTSIGVASSCGVGADLKYTYEGSIWKLLSRGRCAEGEWVVMVAECQPECRPRPCLPGQVEHRGQCVNMTDTTVCDGGQVLYIDQTGSTFCDCENDHFYYPWDGQCYTRQEQGPCDFGYYLDLNENGKVDCVPNFCEVDGYVQDPVSGRCFRKDYVGYCQKDRLQFHNNNQTVECFLIDIRNIFDRAITRSCTAGSGLDHFGNCRSEFVVPTVTALPRSLRTGCYTGTITVGGGACRRVNNYIS